jgi:hypothetical protein
VIDGLAPRAPYCEFKVTGTSTSVHDWYCLIGRWCLVFERVEAEERRREWSTEHETICPYIFDYATGKPESRTTAGCAAG